MRASVFVSSLSLALVFSGWGPEPDASGPTPARMPAPAPLAEFQGHERPRLDPFPPGTSIPGLDSLAAATFDDALRRLAVRTTELGFDKRYVEDDTFRLAVVEDLMDDPMALPGFQTELVQSIRDHIEEPSALFGRLGRLLAVEPRAMRVRAARETLPRHILEELEPHATDDGVRSAATELEGTVGGLSWSGEEALSTPFAGSADVGDEAGRIERMLGVIQDELDRAFAGIPDSLRTHLLMGAVTTWGGEDDPLDLAKKGTLQFELGASVDTTAELSSDLVLDAAGELDRADLLRAGRALARTTEKVAQLVAAIRDERPVGRPGSSPASPIDPKFAPLQRKITGSVYGAWPSPFGWIVIGDLGDNVYPADVLREIAVLGELGGDDVYRGRVASAVGGLLRSASILVDLEGDDLYDARGHAYALGGAVLGCASLVDLAGNDTYLGDTGSLGAGYFGIGCLYDGGGRDRFEGACLTQGAGAFGLGVLVSQSSPQVPPRREVEPDLAFEQGILPVARTGSLPIRHDENDTYIADLDAQGFGSTFGVGLLYDDSGNDIYRAGGRYLHAPLLPNDFQSLSQGFSIGFRPRAAGGVGLLIDEEGNDFYDAEVYAQGASYWYSLGLLFDGAGNDRYLATQYAQGAGVHLSIGSLWDRGGDDHYVSKNGVVQGTAHDLAVGFLRDESGDDFYAVSGGQGVSLTNSFSLFLDEMGDDLYATFEASQGVAYYRRGFSGAAVFLDLEGNDHYPPDVDAANASEWASSNFAIGIDLDRDVILPTEDVPEIVLTAEDSLRAVDELFETASLWEVGSAREKVRRARLALIDRGMPAVLYATGASGPYPDGEPLTSDDGLVYRTLQELAKAHPDSFATRLIPRLGDPREQVQRNVIGLLGDMKWKPARGPFEALLSDPRAETHWNRLIQALGKLDEPAAATAIRLFLTDPMERRRIVTVEALQALKDDESIPGFVALLSDPYFTVRSAAMSGLVSFRERSVAEIVEVLERSREGEPVAGAAGAAPSLDRVHTVLTLGLIAGALADSTDHASVDARERAVKTLFAELKAARARLESEGAADSEDAGGPGTSAKSERTVGGDVGDDPAAVAAAAVRGLLSVGDEEIVAEVGAQVVEIDAPLVTRTWERRKGE